MRTLAPLIALMTAVVLAGCSATYRNHGYIPPEEELQELVVGIDTRATIEDLVGPPSSGGVLENGNYFYVRSRTKTLGLRAPQEIERQVLAMSFDGEGVLANIERFGLEDGRVVSLSRRVTSSSVNDVSFIRQLLGNIGQIGPEGAFGG
ncbi:outer membrane protein assembly factor BamE [uncultured Tateyamaria sp.]|uniref:outer membrane protein assembly factor BamE n=1 Tax=Tateyamaria sp. TaxID=1929288 RepID=UPI00262C408D|nr:outer membrane protein assembly factor BamE [uncultured Tateyamaria sp.]